MANDPYQTDLNKNQTQLLLVQYKINLLIIKLETNLLSMTPKVSLISFLLQIWDNYDVDGNGYLDQAELRVGSQMTFSDHKSHPLLYVEFTKNRGTLQEYSSNHLNIALLNLFWYLNGKYRHILIP